MFIILIGGDWFIIIVLFLREEEVDFGEEMEFVFFCLINLLFLFLRIKFLEIFDKFVVFCGFFKFFFKLGGEGVLVIRFLLDWVFFLYGLDGVFW